MASQADPQWASSWRGVYTHPFYSGAPWFVALGNHDWRTWDLQAQLLGPTPADWRWNAPDLNFTLRWPVPPSVEEAPSSLRKATAAATAAAASGRLTAGHPVVSDITAGGAQPCLLAAVFVDTSSLRVTAPAENAAMAVNLASRIAAGRTNASQLAWARAQLQASATSGCRATLLVGHHPLLSAYSAWPDDDDLIAALGPLLHDPALGIDAYLCGHVHNMLLMRTGVVAPNANNGSGGDIGVDHIISGGGSAVDEGQSVRASRPELVWRPAPADGGMGIGGFLLWSVNASHSRGCVVATTGSAAAAAHGELSHSWTRPLRRRSSAAAAGRGS